jgi:hypothetical protein
VRIEGEPRGSYLFFNFLMEATGLVPRHHLLGVAVDMGTGAVSEDASELLLPALSAIELSDPTERPLMVPDSVNHAFELALGHAFRERDNLKEELTRLNDAIAINRQESLRQSLRVRQDRIRDLIAGASEPRILRMREAQFRNVEARVNAKLAEIEERMAITVGVEPMAGGYLEIV